MNILLTNDDGILAPGLAAMRHELLELGDVTVVAPASPQSAAAHAITVGGPVPVRQIHAADRFTGYAVEGRPADCVKLAVATLLGFRPDLVVSGINDGANVSINVLYSGTVAAAAEGALLGIPSVAVSLERGDEMDFDRAARIARQVIERLLQPAPSAPAASSPIAGSAVREAIPPLSLKEGVRLVNMNIPALRAGIPKGVRVVRQSTQIMQDRYARHAGVDGRLYFWLEGEFVVADHQGITDLEAIRQGYVTLTPLHFDLTHEEQLRRMSDWQWD